MALTPKKSQVQVTAESFQPKPRKQLALEDRGSKQPEVAASLPVMAGGGGESAAAVAHLWLRSL